MARPTKLTAEVQKTITDAIAIGATYQAAAEYAGISYDTFNAWMRDERPKFRQFSEAVVAANARARINLLARIQKAAQGTENKDGDWRAAAWVLERRFGDEYGQTVKFGKMSDDELRAYIAAQLERVGAGDSGSEAARAADSPAETE
jgi:hypothetical protein